MSKSKNLNKKMVMLLLSFLGTSSPLLPSIVPSTFAMEGQELLQDMEVKQENYKKLVWKCGQNKEKKRLEDLLDTQGWNLGLPQNKGYVGSSGDNSQSVWAARKTVNKLEEDYVKTLEKIIKEEDIKIDVYQEEQAISILQYAKDKGIQTVYSLDGSEIKRENVMNQDVFIIINDTAYKTNLQDLHITYESLAEKAGTMTNYSEESEPYPQNKVPPEIENWKVGLSYNNTEIANLTKIKEACKSNKNFLSDVSKMKGKASAIVDLDGNTTFYKMESKNNTNKLRDLITTHVMEILKEENPTAKIKNEDLLCLVWGTMLYKTPQELLNDNFWKPGLAVYDNLTMFLGADAMEKLIPKVIEMKKGIVPELENNELAALKSVLPSVAKVFNKDHMGMVNKELGASSINAIAGTVARFPGLLQNVANANEAEKAAKLVGKRNGRYSSVYSALKSNRNAKIGFGVTSGVLLTALAARDFTANNSLIKKLAGLATQNKTSKMKTNNSLRNEKEQLKNMSK